LFTQDNKLFDSISSNGHQWKWDESAGVLIWGPKAEESSSEYMAWNELIQWLKVEKNSNGIYFLYSVFVCLCVCVL
jgi:hypothetical protein